MFIFWTYFYIKHDALSYAEDYSPYNNNCFTQRLLFGRMQASIIR